VDRQFVSSNPIKAAERLDLDTRIQYGLMFLFGALCLVAAVAPLELLVKAVVVSALFGFTAGLWVAHLVQIVQSTATRSQESGGPTDG
jgi:VIT1/CCC1 family predicted Fe2+/Mn2+ transporter